MMPCDDLLRGIGIKEIEIGLRNNPRLPLVDHRFDNGDRRRRLDAFRWIDDIKIATATSAYERRLVLESDENITDATLRKCCRCAAAASIKDRYARKQLRNKIARLIVGPELSSA